MTQRTIVISDECIFDKLDENGNLSIYISLWNDGSEIPLDWHDDRADFMELKVEFSFQHIIDEMISFNQLLTEDEVAGIWFDIKDKKLVDAYRRELKSAIARLDQIQYWEEKQDDHV